VVSICHQPGLAYPAPEAHSPVEIFPEYRFRDVAVGGNSIYGLVRQCFRDASADAQRFGTPEWNPLGDWIDPGNRVFVLPNLVVDQRPSESAEDFQGKCTQGAVLRAVMDYAIIAAGSPERVAFGNAPLQSCDYAKVTDQAGMTPVADFFRERTGATVGAVDLRGVVTRWTRYGALVERREQRLEDVVMVDLGSDSLLDEFYRRGEPVEMRVSDYDHREMAYYHSTGRHVYAIHRAILDADVIISVPKLKTHEKVGITCALKGTVGTISRKECLAHHRKGGPQLHGDEYPRDSRLHALASGLADRVSTLDSELISNAARVPAKVLYKLLRLGKHGIMAGAWHGNDTAWRMALDISRIVRFGRPDGSMAATPQRLHLVVVDGIVGGEAEGPVYPTGIPLGVVMFGSDPVWTDFAAAQVMQFDPRRIPLISHATDQMRWPVTETGVDDVQVVIDGAQADFSALRRVLNRGFVPPKGWRERIR
jgi:uncharacterized protein (DUF362 family)